MNKQEIIDALNAQGVTFDPAQSKAELAALLGSTAGKPGDAPASETTGDAPTGDADAKPADDKPAEEPPAETIPAPALPAVAAEAPAAGDPPAPDAPQEETPRVPSPFPKLIPDEDWTRASQAHFEAMLAEKISAGLSKEQAMEVIERQIDWDLNGAR